MHASARDDFFRRLRSEGGTSDDHAIERSIPSNFYERLGYSLGDSATR